MSEQQSGPVGPRQDEQLAHETQGLVKGGHSTRAEEWRDPEPLDHVQDVARALGLGTEEGRA